MLFTYGLIENYEKLFAEVAPDNPLKRGADHRYPGGIVFQSYDEAWWNKPDARYGVYGVWADWDKDTYQFNDPKGHRLLKDSEMVKIEIWRMELNKNVRKQKSSR